MLRGRRVVLIVLFGFVFSALLLPFKVKADYLLTKERAVVIAANTSISLQEDKIYLGKPVTISIEPQGMNKKMIFDQKIQALIFLGDTLLETDDIATGKARIKTFQFTPQDFGKYRIIFINNGFPERIFSYDTQLTFSIP